MPGPEFKPQYHKNNNKLKKKNKSICQEVGEGQ
jgi:hypothetical protein